MNTRSVNENCCLHVEDAENKNGFKKLGSRKSLKLKFDEEKTVNKYNGKKSWSKNPDCDKNWYDAFSLRKSNVYGKEAWKSGAEKIWETLGNVRSTFGSFSQKITKSTKQRQPLINVESPNTTPYERSRAVLGRTPTKLYSPFDFDTPKKKDHSLDRKTSATSYKRSLKFKKRKNLEALSRSKQLSKHSSFVSDAVLSDESLQTQIGIYEFQSVANKIIKFDQENQ